MILYRTQWITQKMLRYTRNLFVFWKIDLILSWQIRFVVPVFPPNLLRTRFSDFCLVSSLNAFSFSCFYFFFRFCWYFDDFFHFMLLRFTQSKTNGKVENGENTEALFPCFFFLFCSFNFPLFYCFCLYTLCLWIDVLSLNAFDWLVTMNNYAICL